MDSNTTTKWINRKSAAVRADVIMRTIDNWLASGKLTKYADGVGRVWIDQDELDRLITPQPVTVVDSAH